MSPELSGVISELAAGLGTALGLFTAVWLWSLVRRDASVVDLFWGLGFVAVAATYAVASGGAGPRRVLVLALVGAWGLRLSGYLAWRNLGRPEDYRYREMRERRGRSFPWVSLVSVFWLQAVILWIVSWPLAQAIASPVPARLTWVDGAGAALVAVGLLFETVGDAQLARFKARRRRAGGEAAAAVLDRGLWRYTRHPNYFGDALVWWGMGTVALATPGAAWSLIGPALMTFFLMRVSGVTLLEKRLRETKPAYRDYVRRTNAFFPWFPKRG